MSKSKEQAESREQKFWRLFVQIASEYQGEVPEWLWDYCQACAYGNNQQFTRAANCMLSISSYEPAVTWLSEIYGNHPSQQLTFMDKL